MSLNPLLDPHEDTSFFGSDLVENQGIDPSSRILTFGTPGAKPFVDLWSKITRVSITWNYEETVNSVDVGVPYNYTVVDNRSFVGEADREVALLNTNIAFRVGALGLPWVGPALHPQRPSFGSNDYPFFYAVALGDYTTDISVTGTQPPGPPIVGSSTTFSGDFTAELEPVEGYRYESPPPDPEYVDTLGDITQAVWTLPSSPFRRMGPKYLVWDDFDQGGVIEHSESGSDTETSGGNTTTTTWSESITIQLLTT